MNIDWVSIGQFWCLTLQLWFFTMAEISICWTKIGEKVCFSDQNFVICLFRRKFVESKFCAFKRSLLFRFYIRRIIEEKFYCIWANNKYRARIYLPLFRGNEIIGAELLSYFPYLYHCARMFSTSHIVQIGYFQFSEKANERKCRMFQLLIRIKKKIFFSEFHFNIWLWEKSILEAVKEGKYILSSEYSSRHEKMCIETWCYIVAAVRDEFEQERWVWHWRRIDIYDWWTV